MIDIPRAPGFDSSLAFKRDPYEFISNGCKRLGTNLFETRLLLRKTICMTGTEAAEIFYDPRRFKRQGAAPSRVQKTLFGVGGIQSTDDHEHVHRKRMFMSLMTPDRIRRLAELTLGEWQRFAVKWQSLDDVVLYDEVHELLARAVCKWAGAPLEENDVGRRTKELAALFDLAGAIGPPHWRSRRARKNAEKWATGLIEAIRSREIEPSQDSTAHRIAWHRDVNGELPHRRIAAVDLLNVLRPTVALSVYIVFLAHALHEHPEWRDTLRSDDTRAMCFVQEVRRLYPFFPAVPALVREEFEWNGYRFPANTRVMLDLYGTNHDPVVWEAPDAFRPERFLQWDGNAFSLIPQGGGDYVANHRCPGEWITMELMKVSLQFLVSGMRYAVPEQDLEIDRSRLPALPRSRFVIRSVRPVARAAEHGRASVALH